MPFLYDLTFVGWGIRSRVSFFALSRRVPPRPLFLPLMELGEDEGFLSVVSGESSGGVSGWLVLRLLLTEEGWGNPYECLFCCLD